MANNTNGYPLRLLLTVVDRITQPLNAINKRIETVTTPARAASNALSSLSEVAGIPKLEAALTRVGTAAKNVGTEAMQLGKRVAIGVAAASFALYEVVQRSVDSAAGLKFQGGRLGIAPSTLSAWGYAAKQAGIDQEGFFGGLDFFNKTLGQLKANEGPLHRLLKENWPDLLKQLQGTKSNENAFSMILAAADKLPDLNKKAALFAGAFGRGNKAAVDMATEGTEKFRAFAAQWRELNGGQDFNAFAKESVEFIQAENKIGISWEALQRRLQMPVMPILRAQMDRLTKYLTEHQAEIEAFAKKLKVRVEKFFDELPGRLERLLSLLERIKAVLQPFADAVGGWPQLFGLAAAAILGGPLLGAIATLTTALGGLAIAAGLTPIGWLADAVIAISAAAALIIVNWDPIKTFFKDLWAAVRIEFQGFLDFLQGVFTRDLTRTMRGLSEIANPYSFLKKQGAAGNAGASDSSGNPHRADPAFNPWYMTSAEDTTKQSTAQGALRQRAPRGFSFGLSDFRRLFAWIDGVDPSTDQSSPLPRRPSGPSTARASVPQSSETSSFIDALQGLVDQLKTAGPRVSIDVTAVPGTRAKVTPAPGSGTTVDLSMGYTMPGSH